MQVTDIRAEPRQATGSSASRRLRTDGIVPAVLYGRGEGNQLLAVERTEIERLLEEHAFIVNLHWDGQDQTAQVREVQYDAFGDMVLHVDFVRISLTETIVVSVPVQTHGDPAGAAEGGVLDQRQYQIEVECLPTDIPDQITVEVSELEIGDAIRLGQMALPPGVRPVADPGTVMVTVLPPAEVEEEEEEALLEELMVEPEVIGREEEEEEEAIEGPPEPEEETE